MESPLRPDDGLLRRISLNNPFFGRFRLGFTLRRGLAAPMNMQLVPPTELLINGDGDREGFVNDGPPFLWNALVPRAHLKPNNAVLDIGSGDGKYARVLAEYLSPEGKYRGFDVLPEVVKWCQESYRTFPNFGFDLAEVHSDWYLPDCSVRPEEYCFIYGDDEFDVAFAVSLFTHLEPRAAQNYFNETFRVLKSGGRLLLTCFLLGPDTTHALDVQGRTFEPSSDIHSLIDPDFPSRGVAYREEAMRQMLQHSGFIVSEMTFGTWSKGKDLLGAFQDTIYALKP
jgi:SAM-dependent methyltransferase